MGIAGSLLTKVGLPIGLIALAGFLIYNFRKPILSTISGGANTIGQAISTPFGALLEGINTGFQTVPDFLTFKLPGFKFEFGDNTGGFQQTTGEADPRFIPGNPLFDPSLIDPNPKTNCKIIQKADGTVIEMCDEMKKQMNEIENNMNLLPGAEGAKFTLFGSPGSSLLVNLPSLPGGSQIRRERLTRAEIVEDFPRAIGLFDLLSTKQTEFIPLSSAELKQFPGDFRLSGQLFKEIPSEEIARSLA